MLYLAKPCFRTTVAILHVLGHTLVTFAIHLPLSGNSHASHPKFFPHPWLLSVVLELRSYSSDASHGDS